MAHDGCDGIQPRVFFCMTFCMYRIADASYLILFDRPCFSGLSLLISTQAKKNVTCSINMEDLSTHRPSPVVVEDAVPELFGDVEVIRRGITALAESSALDKDSALSMTRLFHAMEMLMRHECARRDATVCRLESELERSRIQHELDRVSNAHHHALTTPLKRK